MDFLVDLGRFVGVHEIVPVNVVLGDKVESAEGSDEWTGDAVHDGHAEHHHDTSVLFAKPELVLDRVPHVGCLCRRTGPAQLHYVPGITSLAIKKLSPFFIPKTLPYELWQPHQLKPCPDESGCDGIIDKESTRVG